MSRAISHYIWFGLNEGHSDEAFYVLQSPIGRERDKDTSVVREIFLIGREAIQSIGDCNTLKSFQRPHHCDPHLDQTKLNDLLPLTIDGVLVVFTMMYGLTVDWRFPGQEDLCWEICSPYCLRETDFSLMKTEVGSPTR